MKQILFFVFVVGFAACKRLDPLPEVLRPDSAAGFLAKKFVKTSPSSEDNPLNIPKCTASDLSKVEGFLLDLDGVIYDPTSLLPGVVEFFDWLVATDLPFVLLSNGFKGKENVSKKLSMDPFKLNVKIDPDRVHTAGIAAAHYMADHAPKGAKVYAIGSSYEYSDGSKDFITRIMQREVPKELYDSWDIRTDLTLHEIHEWSHLSRDKGQPVYVVLAVMGVPNDGFGDDPVTHKPGYTTMDYELMKKVVVLLRNKAHFVVGAPDVAESRAKSKAYPNIDTSWPTMGAYEKLFLFASEMFPGSEKEMLYHASTGKGGREGVKYMVQPALEKMENQSPNIAKENIMIIGDNFGTDIRAGNEAGIQSMLVTSGAHRPRDAPNWDSRPTCYLSGVGDIPKLLPSEEMEKNGSAPQQMPSKDAMEVDAMGVDAMEEDCHHRNLRSAHMCHV